MVIATVWQLSGFAMAMYLAGLRGIPEEWKEAARVDGAGEWTIFRRILLAAAAPDYGQSHHYADPYFLENIRSHLRDDWSGSDVRHGYARSLHVRDDVPGQSLRAGAAISMVMLVLISLLIVPYLLSSMRKEEA